MKATPLKKCSKLKRVNSFLKLNASVIDRDKTKHYSVIDRESTNFSPTKEFIVCSNCSSVVAQSFK